jgi:alpha-tubulin suppressor-like RCC1 family protein
VRQIAAGSRHSCALTASGAVYCWGVIYFRPANPAAIITNQPERVPGLSPAVSIAVGDSHGCAALADGRVACWGNNYSGQVGLGSIRVPYRGERPLLARPSNPPEHQPGPALVPGVQAALGVAAGESASCALLSGGSLVCWGQGFACEGPTPMPELGAGNYALTAGHGAFCWLGPGGVPKDVPPINTRAERDPACHPYDHDPRAEEHGPPAARAVACNEVIGCSDCFGCAVTTDGSLSCWQPRDARPGPVDEVLEVAREVRDALAVAVERATICVITAKKRLLCWGWNLRSELGTGSVSQFEMLPVEPVWPR